MMNVSQVKIPSYKAKLGLIFDIFNYSKLKDEGRLQAYKKSILSDEKVTSYLSRR